MTEPRQAWVLECVVERDVEDCVWSGDNRTCPSTSEGWHEGQHSPLFGNTHLCTHGRPLVIS